MICRALRRNFQLFHQRRVILLGVAVITVLYFKWRLNNLAGKSRPHSEELNYNSTFRTIDKFRRSDKFQQQWCRMQRWRVDWKEMAKHCEGRVAWTQRQAKPEWRTGANRSFITKWDIQPAGHFSSFFIQSVKRDGLLKYFGGDAWHVRIRQGPASFAPQVWDNGDGQYEVVFLAMEPGNYSVEITLDYTLCDGLRDPPLDWFIKGCNGRKQAEGILGYISDDYIREPVGGQAVITFTVPENTDAMATSFSAIPSHHVPDNASMTTAEKSITQEVTLYIFGDSLSRFLKESLTKRGICTTIFKKCKLAYMWVYEVGSEYKDRASRAGGEPTKEFSKTRVLQYMTKVLDSPDMRSPYSVFLFNLGAHYSITLNFTTYKDLIDDAVKLIKTKFDLVNGTFPIPIWKTTTYADKVKQGRVTHWRFHTYQRLQLYHKYATSVMCKAGIPVLDVHPMTASYPNGPYDHIHYPDNVQRAAEDQLVTFITEKMNNIRRDNAAS